MTREEKIATIAQFYGYEPQSRQCIEEMAELTQAINKLWRASRESDRDRRGKDLRTKNARNDIIEELADVQIMVWQMSLLLVAGNEIEDIIDEKLDRQIARIEHE